MSMSKEVKVAVIGGLFSVIVALIAAQWIWVDTSVDRGKTNDHDINTPHAPPIEINQRYLIWEEKTMQFHLEPGDNKILKGMELYSQVATYPETSCAGPGFVPYTWQVRVPYPQGGDLEIRRVLMGGKMEQVGLGSMGRGRLGYCGEHTFKNNGTYEILVEVRYASAASQN